MPYVYKKVDELENTDMVGSHQCVALVQTYTDAPTTLAWRQGEAVLGNSALAKGTAIATFVNGKYANRSHGNHTARYLGQTVNGILVMDQWKTKPSRRVSARPIRRKGKYKSGDYIQTVDNADAYFVIE